MKPFGGGHVQVTNGHVTDDGDFNTANKDPVPYRAYAIWRGPVLVAGVIPPPPSRVPKVDERPFWLLTRDELEQLDLAEEVDHEPGTYHIQLWGGVETDPDWYELGSANAADNGNTDVVVATDFTVGPEPPPDPDDAALALQNLRASALGLDAIGKWTRSNPVEARNLEHGDFDPAHYATRFGKFLAHLNRAAQ